MTEEQKAVIEELHGLWELRAAELAMLAAVFVSLTKTQGLPDQWLPLFEAASFQERDAFARWQSASQRICGTASHG